MRAHSGGAGSEAVVVGVSGPTKGLSPSSAPPSPGLSLGAPRLGEEFLGRVDEAEGGAAEERGAAGEGGGVGAQGGDVGERRGAGDDGEVAADARATDVEVGVEAFGVEGSGAEVEALVPVGAFVVVPVGALDLGSRRQ